MKVAILAFTAFLVASPHQSASPPAEPQPDGGPPFGQDTRTFASAAACSQHLSALVRASGPPAYDVAVGPYAITAEETRAHRIKAQGWGHEIEEFQCLRSSLSSRRWTHSMSDVKPFTVEDIGRMSFPAD